ncbi:hypothetical protein [Spiroplasma eriocheiris]|uniref:Uncharacterized protein n=2 Tax=Spiroplasma TaxID=2132 RepID=A0A0H3XIH3_9MOLU|nr:hypothetical protein [Spiroplasma eriocheiris]AHF58250.1 hypothetical protein SPE_1136 [Spiroplasma eriocheiris CCTCC M 207170]AKM54688.1 hypothetical protein SERIO_v1c11350 [Spiroplasma eriocheiris]
MTNFLNYFLYAYQLLKTFDKGDFEKWPDLTGAFANYLHPAATPYFEILGTKISFWNTSEASLSFIAGATPPTS